MKKRKKRTVEERAADHVQLIDKVFGGKLRSRPWHAIFAAQLRDGTASPEIVKLAEASRRQWEEIRDRVPMFVPAAPAPASSNPAAQPPDAPPD